MNEFVQLFVGHINCTNVSFWCQPWQSNNHYNDVDINNIDTSNKVNTVSSFRNAKRAKLLNENSENKISQYIIQYSLVRAPVFG